MCYASVTYKHHQMGAALSLVCAAAECTQCTHMLPVVEQDTQLAEQEPSLLTL